MINSIFNKPLNPLIFADYETACPDFQMFSAHFHNDVFL